MKNPTVSIGMPVYNGENYIAEGINAILDQTFNDFELIITDNDSTDCTEEICREFAKRDSRIRYYRNDKNLGAARNFNAAFTKARGKYFKWGAHDDLLSPLHLEKCVSALENDTESVLAYPETCVIDENGKVVEQYAKELNTDSALPSERYESLIQFGNKCFEVFGLIKSEALRKTLLIGSFSHSDGVLLAHLALMGKFVSIKEPLFYARKHSEQSMTMIKDYRKYAAWFDPRLKNRLLFPYYRMHYEFMKVVANSELNFTEKIRCYKAFAFAVTKRWKLFVREALYPIKYYGLIGNG